MLEKAMSALASFAALLAPRRDPIPIPIRRDDWRGPRRDDRRH